MKLSTRGLILTVITLVLIAVALAAFYAVRASERISVAPSREVSGGNPEAGRQAIARYGCGSCHTIPGLRRAEGRVGPPLARVSERSYLAGRLPNTPENMIRWIQYPQDFVPGTAMPNLGVTESEARDIAAYLYRLH